MLGSTPSSWCCTAFVACTLKNYTDLKITPFTGLLNCRCVCHHTPPRYGKQRINLRIWVRSCPIFRGEKPVSLDACCKSLLLISEMHKLLFDKFYLIYFLPPFLLLFRVQCAAKLDFRTQKLDVSLNMPSFSLPSFSSYTITIACLTAFSYSFYWMYS